MQNLEISIVARRSCILKFVDTLLERIGSSSTRPTYWLLPVTAYLTYKFNDSLEEMIVVGTYLFLSTWFTSQSDLTPTGSAAFGNTVFRGHYAPDMADQSVHRAWIWFRHWCGRVTEANEMT